MVTGASTAELALILIDARHGVVEQTRRHLAVTGLLGVRHVALAVNKMDLVDWDQRTFDTTRGRVRLSGKRFRRRRRPGGAASRPCSATTSSTGPTRASWYAGPTLLEHLESVPVGTDPAEQPLRMPVQYVIRPQGAEHRDYRGYAGRLASGVVHVGDEVVVLPAGSRTTVVGIDRSATPGEPGRPDEHDVAFAPQSVVLRLADDLDVSRGDLIASVEHQPQVVQEIVGTLAVLSDRPLRERDRVLLRVGTRNVRGLVDDLVDELDITTMRRGPAPASLPLNAIGRVRVRLAEPVRARRLPLTCDGPVPSCSSTRRTAPLWRRAWPTGPPTERDGGRAGVLTVGCPSVAVRRPAPR